MNTYCMRLLGVILIFFTHITFSITVLDSFKEICDRLPECPEYYQDPVFNWEEFELHLHACCMVMANDLFHGNSWLGSFSPPDHFCNPLVDVDWSPYVQKLVLSAGDRIAFFGDLHGSLHSLVRCLAHLSGQGYIDKNLRIKRCNFYLVFLGDYVDLGAYGMEVLLLLVCLKLMNPQQVILLRGDHECKRMNYAHGFDQELTAKFPRVSRHQIKQIYRFFDMLPLALFLGTQANKKQYDYIVCAHAGLELGYRPCQLLEAPSSVCFDWLYTVKRKTNSFLLSGNLYQAISCLLPQNELRDFVPLSVTNPLHIGFMWHNFDLLDDGDAIVYEDHHDWIWGRQLTEFVLRNLYGTKHHMVHAMFRGHQHHGHMLNLLERKRGYASIWNGLVHTLCSAPEITSSNKIVDSYVLLDVARDYVNWRIRHVTL